MKMTFFCCTQRQARFTVSNDLNKPTFRVCSHPFPDRVFRILKCDKKRLRYDTGNQKSLFVSHQGPCDWFKQFCTFFTVYPYQTVMTPFASVLRPLHLCLEVWREGISPCRHVEVSTLSICLNDPAPTVDKVLSLSIVVD